MSSNMYPIWVSNPYYEIRTIDMALKKAKKVQKQQKNNFSKQQVASKIS